MSPPRLLLTASLLLHSLRCSLCYSAFFLWQDRLSVSLLVRLLMIFWALSLSVHTVLQLRTLCVAASFSAIAGRQSPKPAVGLLWIQNFIADDRYTH